MQKHEMSYCALNPADRKDLGISRKAKVELITHCTKRRVENEADCLQGKMQGNKQALSMLVFSDRQSLLLWMCERIAITLDSALALAVEDTNMVFVWKHPFKAQKLLT